MLTIICVLKSGGEYTAAHVAKLRDGVKKYLRQPHRFVCLSDVDVPCDRIPLLHNWPGWWSKIELFRPGVIEGNTLYFDLDNVPIADLSPLLGCQHPFAMLRNFNHPENVSSCVMWFGEAAPAQVYQRFAQKPEYWIQYHINNRDGSYLGDQAFIGDVVGKDVPRLHVPRPVVASYKKDCLPNDGKPPEGAVMVAFGGRFRPWNVHAGWIDRAYA